MTFRRPRGWARWRHVVLVRDAYRCHICGLDDPPADTIDHVVPRHLGGTHALANLAAAHDRCNKSKGAKPALLPQATIADRWR